jgi:protein-tyrosine phosphatase
MPTEILSGLWIGSIDDLKHPSFFEDMEINIIVNLTDCDFKVQKKVSYINLPISSYNIYSMNNMIFKLVDNIHNNLKDGLNNIYIYCINGLTISPLIVGVYMIKYGSVTKYDVPVILKSKNNEILLNIDDYPNLLC